MEYADPRLGDNNRAIADIFRGQVARENSLVIQRLRRRTSGLYRFGFPWRQKKRRLQWEIRRPAKPHAPLGSLPSVALSCARVKAILVC